MVNLKASRKGLDMTQAQLASVCGVSESYLSLIEAGERRPSVEAAKRIAGVLGFDWTRFFEETGSESA